MNTLKIHDIRRVGTNRFEYNYTVEGQWQKYFDLSQPMWAEYNTSVENVPDSIAVLPLIGNFIVLASLMDADIYVDEIDREFYEATGQFLRGFDEVMPDHVHFKLDDIIHAHRIVDNPVTEGPKKSNLLFFSGGVDATFSLVSHFEEKPTLVTVWGADIPWDNQDGWSHAISFNQEVADRYGLDMLTIHSNFRRSYNNDNIEVYSKNLVGDWWWPSFHYSVAMMCLAAPLANTHREKLYFGSTYSVKDRPEWGKYIIASDPKIDNYVQFSGCQVVHDGYECSRYDKVERICAFYQQYEEKPYLRVCYHTNTGKNCGVCEKCVRTIMGILLAGHNPEDYRFNYNAETFPQYFVAGFQEMARCGKFDCLSLYKDLQLALRQKYSVEEISPVLRVFYEVELETLADFLHVPNNEYLAYQHSAQKLQQDLYDQIGRLKYELSVLQGESPANNAALEELYRIQNSLSWKITKPLRWAVALLRKVKRFLKKIARFAKAFLKHDESWTAMKAKIRDKAFHKGAKLINRIYPEGSWRNNYARWRWWFITSDQYKTTMAPLFDKMLREYQSKLWNRGKLLKFDYWLSWILFGAEPDNYFDYEFFHKGWTWRNHHVTKQRLNFIDPVLNCEEHMHLIRNKAAFYTNWNQYLNRNWCVPQDISLEKFKERFQNTPKLIVKPIDLFGGKGIYTIPLNCENIEAVYDRLHNQEHRTVVEEYVNQKGFLHEVYPNALNPLRVTTIRVGDYVEVCYGFFTTGSKGSIISNDCSGGISFSIDTKTGLLGTGQGMTSSGYRAHPDTGVEVYGKYVPDWERIKAFACEAHRHAPEGIGLIGWDICWSDGELSIIEGNNSPGFAELPNRRENQWKKVKGYLDALEK